MAIVGSFEFVKSFQTRQIILSIVMLSALMFGIIMLHLASDFLRRKLLCSK
jgi:hypothetical protein